jgi:Kef-type K+ transport system membrane component KefB
MTIALCYYRSWKYASYLAGTRSWAPHLSEIARRGIILVLFLIGTSLSVRALRAVGWRTVASGLMFWLFISVGSLNHSLAG